MSGWDQTRRVNLDPPWESFWIELYEDPPMADWLDLNEAAAAAMADRTPPKMDAAIRAFQPLIAAHNLTNRAGEPLKELTLRTLSSGLFLALLGAIRRAMDGEGLPPPSAKRESSRGPSSPGRRRPRATTTGA